MNRLLLKDIVTPAQFSTFLKDVRTSMGTTDGAYNLWNELTEQQLADLSSDLYYSFYKKRVTELIRANHENNQSFMTFTPPLVASRCGDNFKRVYDAYIKSEYNPLENYNMYEKRSPDLVDEDTSDTKSEVVSKSKSGEYGFNSTEAVPTNEAETTTSMDKNKNQNHSKVTHKGKEELERSGNIGVTTSQQMLRSELDLRNFDYWRFVFDAVDKIVCRGYMLF